MASPASPASPAPHASSADAGRAAASERARRILERSGIGASGAPRVPDAASARAFVRAESEDDDGYDPYSDRPAAREATFQADPWS